MNVNKPSYLKCFSASALSDGLYNNTGTYKDDANVTKFQVWNCKCWLWLQAFWLAKLNLHF